LFIFVFQCKIKIVAKTKKQKKRIFLQKNSKKTTKNRLKNVKKKVQTEIFTVLGLFFTKTIRKKAFFFCFLHFPENALKH